MHQPEATYTYVGWGKRMSEWILSDDGLAREMKQKKQKKIPRLFWSRELNVAPPPPSAFFWAQKWREVLLVNSFISSPIRFLYEFHYPLSTSSSKRENKEVSRVGWVVKTSNINGPLHSLEYCTASSHSPWVLVVPCVISLPLVECSSPRFLLDLLITFVSYHPSTLQISSTITNPFHSHKSLSQSVCLILTLRLELSSNQYWARSFKPANVTPSRPQRMVWSLQGSRIGRRKPMSAYRAWKFKLSSLIGEHQMLKLQLSSWIGEHQMLKLLLSSSIGEHHILRLLAPIFKLTLLSNSKQCKISSNLYPTLCI